MALVMFAILIIMTFKYHYTCTGQGLGMSHTYPARQWFPANFEEQYEQQHMQHGANNKGNESIPVNYCGGRGGGGRG